MTLLPRDMQELVDHRGAVGLAYPLYRWVLIYVGDALLRCDNEAIRCDESRGGNLFAALLNGDS